MPTLSQSAAQRPNLLLITSDQQHYLTLGSISPQIKTPNLDRLARRGVRFDRAYCPNPTCTPTRASLLTGMWPSVHGAYTLGTKLDEAKPTLGAYLRERGYRTGLVGKAHFQPLASTPECESVESYPTLRDLEFWRTFNDKHTPWYGFDHVELTRNHTDEGHAGQHYGLWLEEKGVKNWRDYFHVGNDGVRVTPTDASKAPVKSDAWGPGGREDMSWQLPAELHYTTFTGERTNAFIESCGDAPWFCWSSYHDPHPPYAVPEPWASMYDPADMDWLIGAFTPGEFDDMSPIYQVTRDPAADLTPWQGGGTPREASHGVHHHADLGRDKLRQIAAAYCGMVSFMDERIGTTLDLLERAGQLERTLVVFTSDHGHFLGQHGLLAKGPFHYEDVIRVPMIAAGPGVPAGETNDAPQTLVDIPAVFAAAATGSVPRWMQGRDQREAWATGGGREAVVVENHHNGEAVHLRTLVTRQHKLTAWRGRPDWGELFDLENDPGELTNLYRLDGELRSRLLETFVQTELDREPAPQVRVAGA